MNNANTSDKSTGDNRRHSPLMGTSPAMREVFEAIDKVAPMNVTVLLQGETGTGKELAAEAIHAASGRTGPFLAVNCGAISESLIGSELFGHERGAFTGSLRQHQGFFERASGGTLFLDEITEMPLDLQVNLLRSLDSGVIRRVGGESEIPVDVRLVAATNRSLEDAVGEGLLREDLYYRLMVFPLTLPPLRRRRGDIPLLARGFLDELNREHNEGKYFRDEALERLQEHAWPGNVRELRHTVQRLFILADRVISARHMPVTLAPPSEPEDAPLHLSVGMSVQEAERRLIQATLAHYGNDKTRAAGVLGISVKTLYNRLRRYQQEGRDDSRSAA